jgi:hypothetical protein
MKTIKLNELSKQALLTLKEPLFIEHDGSPVGYYYPVINHQEVKKAKEELDSIMAKVLAETGLTEEEYVAEFLNAYEESCA